jgi:SAM-dependent methyltransferase
LPFALCLLPFLFLAFFLAILRNLVKPEGIALLDQRRHSSRFHHRLFRLLSPPPPVVHNPRELEIDAPLGRWNLYIGGAGATPDGYVNLDIAVTSGVDVCASAEALPFPGGVFQRVECDAVLEHVERPESVAREIGRVLAPGGFAHLDVPFCHPLHEYPKDFRRYAPDGLRQRAGELEIVSSGWRTGPTATLLIVILEYVKIWLPWRPLRVVAHGLLGWLLFPLRYLDLLLWKSPRAVRLGNHCYVWLRKPVKAN